MSRTASTPQVVFVDSLAEFMREMPAPAVVRVSVTERPLNNDLPQREIQLRVQGRPAGGDELIILLSTRRFLMAAGAAEEPFEEGERALYRELRTRGRDLLREYLSRKGYEVRGGTYGLPEDLAPVRGVVEVLGGEGKGAEFTLRLQEPVE